MTATLAGTVALVTGASSGIGAATARALAGQDAAVALLARRADRLHELVAEIEAAGGTALAVPADVTDADQVASAVAAVIGELGRLDILVNNAGLMRTGDAADAPLKDWDDLVAVNIQGATGTKLLPSASSATPPTWAIPFSSPTVATTSLLRGISPSPRGPS